MPQESSSWLGSQPNRQPSEHLIRCHTSSSLAYLFLCLGPVRVKLEFCCQWKADSWSPRGWTCPSFSCLGGHSCAAVSCSLNRKEGGKVQQIQLLPWDGICSPSKYTWRREEDPTVNETDSSGRGPTSARGPLQPDNLGYEYSPGKDSSACPLGVAHPLLHPEVPTECSHGRDGKMWHVCLHLYHPHTECQSLGTFGNDTEPWAVTLAAGLSRNIASAIRQTEKMCSEKQCAQAGQSRN